MNNSGHKAISALVAVRGHMMKVGGLCMQIYTCMYLMKKQPGFTYKCMIKQV
jgi:hypothetical protein